MADFEPLPFDLHLHICGSPLALDIHITLWRIELNASFSDLKLPHSQSVK
jgi:hypothetical protein